MEGIILEPGPFGFALAVLDGIALLAIAGNAMKFHVLSRISLRELLVGGALLFFYALMLLLAKTEWMMWAGPVTLGVFPASGPRFAVRPDVFGTFRGASAGGLLGLLALVGLLALRGRRKKRTGAKR